MFIFPLLVIIANLLFYHDNCEGDDSFIANICVYVFVFCTWWWSNRTTETCCKEVSKWTYGFRVFYFS